MKHSPSKGRPGLRTTLVLLLLVVSAGACGPGTASEGATSPAPRASGSEDRSTEELEALYRARTDSALMEFTEADVRFMTGMIRHHAQAVEMSELAPTHGANPAIRTLAARIINAQRDEIRTMQTWLRQRGQAVPEAEGSGADPETRMPGMLTPEQMEALNRARGRAFDCLYLQSMIQHHEGAVEAVEDLFATDGAARGDFTFKVTSGIQVDQITEIARMEAMLEEMDGC